jgi:hypothetical protein
MKIKKGAKTIYNCRKLISIITPALNKEYKVLYNPDGIISSPQISIARLKDIMILL